MPEVKAGPVPRLRFPEFRDTGPWEVKSIADLSERIAQGGTPATSVAEYWNGGIPWITPAEMGDDAATHYTSATVRTISAEGLRNSSAELLPVNSVIISSRAPIGYVTINSVEMATNQGCKGIVPCADVHHEFLYFGLLNAKTRLNDIGAGAGFKEISTSSLAAFQIPVPSLPEQQQIADCLTSLDDLIRAEEGRLGALKDHKRGLMQRLFPAPGQTTPRLRFPEFRDAGPWGVKRLGEVAVRVTDRNSPGHNTRVLTNSAELGVVHQREFFNKDIAAKENLARYTVVEIDDFVYNPRISASAPVGPISRNKIALGVMSPLYTIFRFRAGCLDFLEFFFQTNVWHPYLRAVGSTGARHDRLSISVRDFFSLPVLFPIEAEQQKIADCLTSLDDLITALEARLAALQAHKRGLMQQLFPQKVG